MKTVRTPDLLTKAGWAWHATIYIVYCFGRLMGQKTRSCSPPAWAEVQPSKKKSTHLFTCKVLVYLIKVEKITSYLYQYAKTGWLIQWRIYRGAPPPLIGKYIPDSASWDQELSNGIWQVKIGQRVQRLFASEYTLPIFSKRALPSMPHPKQFKVGFPLQFANPHGHY